MSASYLKKERKKETKRRQKKGDKKRDKKRQKKEIKKNRNRYTGCLKKTIQIKLRVNKLYLICY